MVGEEFLVSECPNIPVEIFSRSDSYDSIRPELSVATSSLDYFHDFSQRAQTEADKMAAKFDAPDYANKPSEPSPEQIASQQCAEYVSALGVNLCSVRKNCPVDFALAA
jgi:hypothetical protein